MPFGIFKTIRFKSSTKQDEGWAWVVLFAATLNSFVSLGSALGCGVYVAEVIQRWNSSKATGAFVGSLLFGMFSSSGPLTTVLVSRTSHRSAIIMGGFLSAVGLVASANVPNIIGFYFTFGIMSGIGCGMVFLQSVILVNLYFRKYRGIASGITIAGGGGGVLAMPLLQRMLIDHFSWQPSLYIVAGMCLNTCVLGALMRPIHITTAVARAGKVNTRSRQCKEEDSLSEIQSNGKFYGGSQDSLLKNRTYICYALNNTLYGFGCTIPIILGPDLYAETGFSGARIDILIACFGAGNILGRLVGGVLCNIPALNRLVLYVVLNILLGVFIGFYTLSTSFILYAFASSGYGLIFGAFIVTQAVVTMDIVGRRKMEQAFSFSYFTCSLGIIAGAPLSGSLFDLTKSYTWPYLVAAIVVMSSSILLLPSLWSDNRCGDRENRHRKSLAHLIIIKPKQQTDAKDHEVNPGERGEMLSVLERGAIDGVT